MILLCCPRVLEFQRVKDSQTGTLPLLGNFPRYAQNWTRQQLKRYPCTTVYSLWNMIKEAAISFDKPLCDASILNCSILDTVLDLAVSASPMTEKEKLCFAAVRDWPDTHIPATSRIICQNLVFRTRGTFSWLFFLDKTLAEHDPLFSINQTDISVMQRTKSIRLVSFASSFQFRGIIERAN